MGQGNGDEEKLLLVNVAARRLGYTDQHVRRLIRQGKLEACRKGPRQTKVPESALEDFREHREEA